MKSAKLVSDTHNVALVGMVDDNDSDGGCHLLYNPSSANCAHNPAWEREDVELKGCASVDLGVFCSEVSTHGEAHLVLVAIL
jgi:hypothetical protein